MTRVIRVFPRRTKATPTDPLAWVGPPDLFVEADRVQISVTFSWDMPVAARLVDQWRRVAPVEIGGPGAGTRGGEFTPGMYLKQGYVITSRGCPNDCWFCPVPRRDGPVRELPITEGWIVQDDNLLACSEKHVRAVFAMLARQKKPVDWPKQKHWNVEFSGGLEAAKLKDWHVDLLASLKPRPTVFFAYDTHADREPLGWAVGRLLNAGFTRQSHDIRCYVLIGYPGDTHEAAWQRMKHVLYCGATPHAMLWRSADGRTTPEWRQFARMWTRPAIIHKAQRELRRERL